LTDDRDGERRPFTIPKEDRMTVEGESWATEIEAEAIAIEFDGDFDEERAKRALISARAGERAAKRGAAIKIAALQKELAQVKIAALEKELAQVKIAALEKTESSQFKIAALEKELSQFKSQEEANPATEKSLELKLAAALTESDEFEETGQARIVHDDSVAPATARG
jgi:hypothetical protein